MAAAAATTAVVVVVALVVVVFVVVCKEHATDEDGVQKENKARWWPGSFSTAAFVVGAEWVETTVKRGGRRANQNRAGEH